ncbi:MAG: hypothetical protein QF415_10015 [Candidatus Undinarchaeales archaeon]|jgi:hypothetical protein|nr:hypothetical protein [Candidatus Undinarchaeales archaeon]MDP7491527.1 hypothetical protein [Candidatus Undinarchaeales archaeon]
MGTTTHLGIIVLLIALAVALMGCTGGDDAPPAPTEAPGPAPTEGTKPAPTEVAPAPTKEAPAPTKVPEPEPTEVPSPEPTEAPAPSPTAKPEDGPVPYFLFFWEAWPEEYSIDTFEELNENVGPIFDYIQDQGYNMILLEVPTLDQKYMSTSSILKERKWTPMDGDHLKVITEEAEQRGIPVIINLETIAHRNLNAPGKVEVTTDPTTGEEIPNMMSVEDMVTLVEELITGYTIMAVYSEAFADEYVDAIQAKANELGSMYMHAGGVQPKGHGAVHNSYAYSFYTPDATEFAERFGDLGAHDVIHGVARRHGKPSMITGAVGWGYPFDMAGFEKNIFLYKTVQYPDLWGYFLFVWTEELYPRLVNPPFNFMEDMGKDILEFRRTPEDKPVANLVIDMPGPISEGQVYQATARGISVAVNALTASGYDFAVSWEPLAEADLYYVFSTSTKACYRNWRADTECGEGTGDEEYCRAYYQASCDDPTGEPSDEAVEALEGKPLPVHDLSPAITALLQGDVPVIFHQAYAIPDAPGWNAVMEYFQITTDYTSLPDLPATVEFDGDKVRFKGLPPFDLCSIPTANVGSEVVLSGTVGGAEHALLVTKDDKYLVNGNNLHLDMTYVLANQLEDTLQGPTFSHIVVGKEGSAFLAAEDTTVSVRLPGAPKKARVVIFDGQGKRVQDATEDVGEVFEKELTQYQLMIVEPVA